MKLQLASMFIIATVIFMKWSPNAEAKSHVVLIPLSVVTLWFALELIRSSFKQKP